MFRSVAITLTLCLATTAAQAALLGRAASTPGGTDYQAYYDTATNLTWVADANLAQSSGYDADGLLNWIAAVGAWPASLNTASYLGQNDWRLPAVAEYSALYYSQNVTLALPGSFSNLQTSYWSSTALRCQLVQFCARGGGFWQQQSFNFSTGAAETWVLDGDSEEPLPDIELAVWVVRSGDIASVVPIPGAVWLFGSALGLMGWMRRKVA